MPSRANKTTAWRPTKKRIPFFMTSTLLSSGRGKALGAESAIPASPHAQVEAGRLSGLLHLLGIRPHPAEPCPIGFVQPVRGLPHGSSAVHFRPFHSVLGGSRLAMEAVVVIQIADHLVDGA